MSTSPATITDSKEQTQTESTPNEPAQSEPATAEIQSTSPITMTDSKEQAQTDSTPNEPAQGEPATTVNQSVKKKKKPYHLDYKKKNWLKNRLIELKSADVEGYTFEKGLSGVERRFIHTICKNMGFTSKSSGKGTQRRIGVHIPATQRHLGVHKLSKAEKKKKVAHMASSDGRKNRIGVYKLFRQKVIVKAKKKEKVVHLAFSEEGKDALCDLFTSYPPNDEEDDAASVIHQKKSSSYMRSEYGIFGKNTLCKADIKKKKQLLVAVSQNKNMREIIEKKSQLPIAPFNDVITSTVGSHQVVLISGETGCGKTTQVPQFILDAMWEKDEACKIVCSQPRRISATSVAERIAAERGQTIGDDVGYKIRLESKGGNKTSIVFCTNGVLLKILVSKGSSSSGSEAKNKTRNDALSKLTHIIVDEIHERDRYSDFMLALLRDELPSYPHLRLIIMSATLDAEMFSRYFGGCPVIRVPGFTHPVKAFYLEDVISILASPESSQLSSASSSTLIDSPALTEEEKVVLEEAITTAWSNDEFEPLIDLVQSEGTTEVFNYQHSLNGLTPLMVFAAKGRVNEVHMLLSRGADCSLRDIHGENAQDLAMRLKQTETVEIINNHLKDVDSNLNEEKKIVEKYLKSVKPQAIDFTLIEKLIRKICNDSEDGAILVFLPGWDDIKKIREMLLASSYFKDESKYMFLSLHSMVPPKDQKLVFMRPPAGSRKIILSTNIAETSVTIDDVVYVIDSGKMKEKSYDPHSNVSTLQSSWISKASLKQREGRAARCQPGMCYHLFTREREATLPSFQIPEIKRIPMEELCLQVKMMDPDCNIEAILQKTIDPPIHETIKNGITVLQDIGALTSDERLTELGAKLGLLPVNPLVSKMLFLAILLKCLDPALTFACASDYKDPFVFPFDGRDKAAAAKAKMASIYDGNSDQLAVVAAFECWKRAKENHKESTFYSDYYISPSTMYMLSGMRKQLLNELQKHGFLPGDISSYNINAHDPGILHAVLVAGLYPMIGRLIMGQSGRPYRAELPNGSRVRLHSRCAGSGISVKENCNRPLIIYDEITRTDYGESIRDCTVIGPLPLLLIAREVAVAPTADNSEASNVNGDVSQDNEGIQMHVDPSGDSEGVMSSSTREVMVIIDKWLSFGLTAIDFAQIYCLRERVSKAVTYTVTHPGSELPVVLAASMHALACLLSYDGMSNMGLANKDSKIGDDKFLLSLLRPSISSDTQLPPSKELLSLAVPVRQVQPPVKSKKKKSAASSSQGPNDPAVTRKPNLVGYVANTCGPYGLRPRVNNPPGSVGVKRRLANKDSKIGDDKFLLSPLRPSISSDIQLLPITEPLSLSVAVRQVQPPVKSKKKEKKKKSADLSSQGPDFPAVTPKPTLVGYGATAYGPYGPRAGINNPLGTVGVKRRR